METLICNKCFTPIYRGKQPYSITQCGHISCQNCLEQVGKQCPQCQYIGAMSIPLKEPLMPKVAPFFMPFTETLEMLLKVDMFRNNQMKITMQRFRDLDKKYELLKNQYWAERRSLKALHEKYINLKAEKDKLDKNLLYQMQRSVSRSVSNVTKTPMDSGIFMHPSSTGYSSESSEFLKSDPFIKTRSIRSNDSRREHKILDGFRIPSNHRPPRSVGSFTTPDMYSNHSYTR